MHQPPVYPNPTQVMLHDRFLFNRSSNQWTVPRFLRDVGARYGQLDSVLVWHSYPNIGVDDRSQVTPS